MKKIGDEIQATQTKIEQLNHRKERLTSKLKVEERNGQGGLLSEGRFWKAL